MSCWIFTSSGIITNVGIDLFRTHLAQTPQSVGSQRMIPAHAFPEQSKCIIHVLRCTGKLTYALVAFRHS